MRTGPYCPVATGPLDACLWRGALARAPLCSGPMPPFRRAALEATRCQPFHLKPTAVDSRVSVGREPGEALSVGFEKAPRGGACAILCRHRRTIPWQMRRRSRPSLGHVARLTPSAGARCPSKAGVQAPVMKPTLMKVCLDVTKFFQLDDARCLAGALKCPFILSATGAARGLASGGQTRLCGDSPLLFLLSMP